MGWDGMGWTAGWAAAWPATAGSPGLAGLRFGPPGAGEFPDATRRMAYSDRMKTVIVLAFIAILLALTSAGHAMLRGNAPEQAKGKRMARALTWRIGLSVALFLLILFSHWMGWIQPTGLPVGR